MCVFSSCFVLHRSNAYAKSTTDQEHAETLKLAKEEHKALEAAISKSRKSSKRLPSPGSPPGDEKAAMI